MHPGFCMLYFLFLITYISALIVRLRPELIYLIKVIKTPGLYKLYRCMQYSIVLLFELVRYKTVGGISQLRSEICR